MGDDTVPSEDEASEATEERPVMTLYPDRQLDPGYKWVCVGKSLKDGSKAIYLSDDTWDMDELRGHIENSCTPHFILSNLIKHEG